jgi:adenylyltransferase/sulfurtransferase
MNSDKLLRYSRNITLNGFGIENQLKLMNTKVMVIGLGGLGSVCATNLCANGIGNLGMADNDFIEITNLHRQTLYNTFQAGMEKTKSAYEVLCRLNPNVNIKTYDTKLNEDNIKEILKEYDIIVDCTDNLSSHHLINKACVMNNKKLVIAGVNQYEGFIFSVIPHITPCYRCLYSEKKIDNAGNQGIYGPTVNILGAFQASEAIKLAINSKNALINKMIVIDLYSNQFKEIVFKKEIKCPICGVI